MFRGSTRSTPGSMVFKFELEGAEAFRNHVHELGARKIKAILRNAVTYGITPLLAAAKQLVPEDTKQLRRSMSKVVRTYSSGVTVGVVGPGTGFRAHVTDQHGRLVLRNPTKYAHLVESGHRIAVGGKLRVSKYESMVHKRTGHSAGFVQGFHFMSNAYHTTVGQVENRIGQKIDEMLAKEAAKEGVA